MKNLEKYIRRAENIASRFIDVLLSSGNQTASDNLQDKEDENYRKFTNSKALNEKFLRYKRVDVEKGLETVHKKIEEKPETKIRRLAPWVKFAASIALLIASTALYFLLTDNNINIFRNTTAEIQPGSPKAMLVLSTGEQVDLTVIEDESSIIKDGINIIKKKDAIVYGEEEQPTKPVELKRMNTIIVPRGGEWKLTLDDGTKVWLNAESKLIYPVTFTEQERLVYLEGEAYFEVEHDSERPFIVSVHDDEVKVLGTSFNIKSYANNSNTETTLVEGKVVYSSSSNHSSVPMNPGDQIVASRLNNKLELRRVDTAVYVAWKEGRFEFVNRPLENIMGTIERWYNVDVEYSDDALKQMHFSARLQRYSDVQELLSLIEKTQKVKFTVRKNTIFVDSREE